MTTLDEAQRLAGMKKKAMQGGDVQGSLTLRDYFAAKAMEALVHNRTPEDCASESYAYADAMLAERSK